jgi:hypothetical protein
MIESSRSLRRESAEFEPGRTYPDDGNSVAERHTCSDNQCGVQFRRSPLLSFHSLPGFRMNSKLKGLTIAALVLIGAVAAPASLMAQTYICTTITRTTTSFYTLTDGSKQTVTVIVISETCVPQIE